MVIRIEVSSKTPIYQQIADQLILSISKGDLLEGEALPSVRKLADSCGINPMTVQKAYHLLKERGIVYTNERKSVVVMEQHNRSREDKKKLMAQFRLCLAEMKIAGITKEEIKELTNKEWRV